MPAVSPSQQPGPSAPGHSAPGQSAPGQSAPGQGAPDPLTASQDPASLPALLAEASQALDAGRKPQAYQVYRRVLAIEPAHSEALGWVEEFLRQRRKFADLRDVLMAASRAASISPETRKAQLRDVAGLCESKLRDFDTAITAWKQSA